MAAERELVMVAAKITFAVIIGEAVAAAAVQADVTDVNDGERLATIPVQHGGSTRICGASFWVMRIPWMDFCGLRILHLQVHS